MGQFAQTDFEITCDNEATAQKVVDTLLKMRKESDEHGNFDFQIDSTDQKNKQVGETVWGQHSSGRVQNLEYQCEEVWDKIKKIKGVIEANFPFMIEGDGCCFSNDE